MPAWADCGAVRGSPEGAIASLEAGTDLECNPWGQEVYPSLVNSTHAGNVSRSLIAQAAERMLLGATCRVGELTPEETILLGLQ